VTRVPERPVGGGRGFRITWAEEAAFLEEIERGASVEEAARKVGRSSGPFHRRIRFDELFEYHRRRRSAPAKPKRKRKPYPVKLTAEQLEQLGELVVEKIAAKLAARLKAEA
jgi:hypothetical protein